MVVVRRDGYVPGFLALLAERRKLDDLLSPHLVLLVPQLVQLLRMEIADPLACAASATELKTTLELHRPRFAEILAALGLLIVSRLEAAPDETLPGIRDRLRDASQQLAFALEERYGDPVAGNVHSALHTLARHFLRALRQPSEAGLAAFLDSFGLLFALEQEEVRDPELLALSARERAMEFAASIRADEPAEPVRVDRDPPSTTEEDRHFIKLALRDWAARQALTR
jgi:hypothetical protein